MTIERLKTKYGPMFIPNTDTVQYTWLKETGASAEDEYIVEVCDLLRERGGGETTLDVGANFGCWSVALAHVSPRVLAVEAQPEFCDLLVRTFDQISLPHPVLMEVFPVAASDEIGRAHVQQISLDRPANFGGLMVNEINPREQPDAPMVAVSQMRLDDLVGDDTVAFIKIDVEGMEAKVLRGLERTIKRDRPIMFIEAFHHNTDTRALNEQVRGLGYCVVSRGPNWLAMPL